MSDNLRERAEKLLQDLAADDHRSWWDAEATEVVLSALRDAQRETLEQLDRVKLELSEMSHAVTDRTRHYEQRLAETKCDCGEKLTLCADCAVADWQAAHPECASCCAQMEAKK